SISFSAAKSICLTKISSSKSLIKSYPISPIATTLSLSKYFFKASKASIANGLLLASLGFTEIQTKCSIPNCLALVVSKDIICSQ
ncbi:MAG TPA: hypothetical protein VMS35_06660, partial [Nitrososphaeraceae archaeon]|nr:hypothetical protein [Nitrososphaeraceae archaeon]